MYFYSIEKLKQRLAAGPLQEREGLPYAIAFAFSMSLVTSLPNESLNRWDYIETCFSLVLSLFGTFWLYRQNGGDSGKDFIHRGIVLGWVVFVRFASVVIPAMFGLIALFDFLGVLTDETNRFDFAAIVLVEGAYYIYFGKHLRDLCARSNAVSAPNQAL